MRKKKPKLSIVIPAYNEENRIGKTLKKYLTYFNKNRTDDYEILIVLNGCEDNTLGIVKKFAKKNSTIRYTVFDEPIGKGGALKAGLTDAKGELVSYTDADGSTRAEILDRLVKILDLLPTVDCILGSRNLPGSVVTGKTKSREILSKGFNFGVNLLFNLNIKDTQCGAKVARAKIIQTITDTLSISNMAFDINYLVDIKRAGGNSLEIPIEWEDDLDSKVGNKFKTSLKMALSVIRLRIVYSPFKFLYPVLKPLSEFLYKII